MTTNGLCAGRVHEMIVARAVATPDVVAIIDGTTTVTYRQLVERATPVACALRAAGGGRGRVVGLSCERSVDGVAAIVGILASGAAWLYLPPAWPARRLRHMVDDSQVALVLAAAGSRYDEVGAPTIHLDEMPAVADTVGAEALVDTARGEDACYVIYTSGSTGAPKGVAVSHSGVANMVRELAHAYRVAPGERVLQIASWAWDAAAAEILTTLAGGATLVLAPEATRRGGEELATLLREQHVGVATLTPSLMAALPGCDLPDLHTLVAVGEPCPPSLVDRWATDGRRFLNGYGPTETTVAVSVGHCRPGEQITIGHPLPGVAVRVVDTSGTPTATGQPGELLVGGVQVGHYVNEPLVTADGPFVDADGQRWFRTGDVVRRRDDGTLLYEGRLDDQVKIRGHRVNPAEVEATITRIPHVRACAVLASAGRLIAYVLADEALVDTTTIARKTAGWLPEFMVPNQIHIGEHWPRTETGKLDRAALAATTSTGPDPQTPPADSVLADVLDMLRPMLEVERVAPGDNIFDLGGHSLVAAQLAVMFTDRFGVTVTAAQVIDHPTAAQLATLITQPMLART